MKTRMFPVLALTAAFLVGCEQGPAEQAGENLDEAVEDTASAVENAADDAANAIENAGDKVD